MSDERFDEIDRFLAAAWASQCGARAVANRNPSAESLHLEDVAGERVDFLLDKRVKRMTREELDAAERRPIRKLVTA